jgi:hypothetical protein
MHRFRKGDAVRYTGSRRRGKVDTGVVDGVRDERGFYVRWDDDSRGSALEVWLEPLKEQTTLKRSRKGSG